jgi:hypothetical protein
LRGALNGFRGVLAGLTGDENGLTGLTGLTGLGTGVLKELGRLMGLMGRTGLVEEPAWLEAGVLGGVFMLTLLSEQTNDM